MYIKIYLYINIHPRNPRGHGTWDAVGGGEGGGGRGHGPESKARNKGGLAHNLACTHEYGTRLPGKGDS
jgi:hypothetical protein